MKKVLQVCVGVAALSLSFSAWCAPTAPAAGAMMTGAPGTDHPCRAIEEACKSAGFTKGSGLIKDCMKPLLAGTAVKNISIPADQIEACKAKMAARHAAGAAAAAPAPAGH